MTCGKQFYVCKSRSEAYSNDFCSKKCYGNFVKKQYVCICENCEKPFLKSESQILYGYGIFCEKKCQREFQIGINSPQWKGGISPLRKMIQNHQKYINWRNAVFSRDDYHDWFSGCRGDLVAHHIVKFSDIIEKNCIKTVEEAIECDELWNVSNGVTMLRTTHEAHHDMWGW